MPFPCHFERSREIPNITKEQLHCHFERGTSEKPPVISSEASAEPRNLQKQNQLPSTAAKPPPKHKTLSFRAKRQRSREIQKILIPLLSFRAKRQRSRETLSTTLFRIDK